MQREGGGGTALRIALAAVVALPLAATCVVAYFLLDTNRLKGPVARLVRAQTGRALTINGDLSLQLGRQLSLSIAEAELGNAAWASGPAMVSVDLLDVTVELASLFDGPLWIERLGVEGARVRLERAADGAGNWQIFDDDAEKGSGFDLEEGLPVVLRQLNLDDCIVTYAAAQQSASLRLEIVSLAQRADADGFLDLRGEGFLEDRAIRIEGGIGPFAALLEGRNFRHEFEIEIGDTRLRSRGSVGDLRLLEEVELVFEMHEPDAGFYADLLGVPGALTGSIDLEAVISPNRPGIRAEASGKVGGFDLALTGHVEQPLDLDGLEMEVHLAGPDLALVGEILEIPGLPSGPFEVGGGLRRSGGAVVIRETALSAGGAELVLDAEFASLPDPDGGTARVNLRGSDLGRFKRLLGLLPGVHQQPFEATATLTQSRGGEEHLEASIDVGSNRLALDGILGPYPDYAGSRFEVDLRGPEITDLGDLLGLTPPVAGPYRASGDLAWTGAVLEFEQLAVSAGPIEVRGSGSLENLPDLEGSSLSLDAAGSDLFAVGQWMGTDRLPHHPYSLSGRVGWREKGLVVDGIRGSIGEADIEAAARFGDPGRFADFELDLKLKGPGLDALTAEPLGVELDDSPFELSGKLRRPDTAIEVSDLGYRSANAAVSIDGSLGVPPSFEGMNLAVGMQGPSLRATLPEISGYTAPDRSYRLSGRIQRAGDQALVFDDLEGESGGVSATARGVWDFPSEPASARLELRASGTDLNELGEWEGLALPALPFALEAGIDAAPGSLALDTFSATSGDNDLRGHAKIDFTGKPRITAAVRSNRLDLNAFLTGESHGEEGGDDPDSDDGRVIPDRDLPLRALESADLWLDLDLEELVAGRETYDHVKLDLTVKDGALRVEPLEFVESGGSLLLNLSVKPTPSRPAVDLSLTTRNIRFGFFRAEGQAVETLPPYDIEMALAGSGANVREIAGNLNGSLRIESTGGRIVNSRVEAWFDDFLMQLFDAILPDAEEDPFTRIDCSVLDVTFDRGKLEVEPGLVVRTDRQNLFARGEIELKSERLNIGFRTEARRGIGISVGKILNPFVRVGGTLGDPSLTLDATGAVLSGTAAWATGGLSIALRTLWDRIQGTQNPCVRMLEPAE